jgi:hypothetical protein
MKYEKTEIEVFLGLKIVISLNYTVLRQIATFIDFEEVQLFIIEVQLSDLFPMTKKNILNQKHYKSNSASAVFHCNHQPL